MLRIYDSDKNEINLNDKTLFNDGNNQSNNN